MPDPARRILAIDIGDRRIGLAVSDPSGSIAQPLATLSRRPGRRFPLKQLRSFLDEYAPARIVVGLPLMPDGGAGERVDEVRRIGALIEDRTNIPVFYQDERMSTARALEAVRALGGRTRGRKADVDPLAATVILQQYLDLTR